MARSQKKPIESSTFNLIGRCPRKAGGQKFNFQDYELDRTRPDDLRNQWFSGSCNAHRSGDKGVMPQVPRSDDLCHSYAASDGTPDEANYFRLPKLQSDQELHAFSANGGCLCRWLCSRSEFEQL